MGSSHKCEYIAVYYIQLRIFYFIPSYIALNKMIPKCDPELNSSSLISHYLDATNPQQFRQSATHFSVFGLYYRVRIDLSFCLISHLQMESRTLSHQDIRFHNAKEAKALYGCYNVTFFMHTWSCSSQPDNVERLQWVLGPILIYFNVTMIGKLCYSSPFVF